MFGPVLAREFTTIPRRPRHFAARTVYVLGLLVLTGTAWLLVSGTQHVRNIGDMARFGGLLFQILAPLQLALITFLTATLSALSVAQEKDRRTLILLLLTSMTNVELVLGQLFASLLNTVCMFVAAIPLFLLFTLFGGVSAKQVMLVSGVTLVTSFAAGSLGSTVALWRDKTFQTLAITAMGLVMWIATGEVIYSGLLTRVGLSSFSSENFSVWVSPLRAVMTAARSLGSHESNMSVENATLGFMAIGSLLALVLNGLAILRVRIWNPSREIYSGLNLTESDAVVSATANAASADEAARSGHVDARLRTQYAKSRRVWDNPILWREICTWAYGRKVLVLRCVYALLFAMLMIGLNSLIASGEATRRGDDAVTIIPSVANFMAPFLVMSLVIVNALAVNSITNERDGGAIDLLLVTDVSAKEFVFGKMVGVLYVACWMLILPMFACGYLWWFGGLSSENFVFCLLGISVLNLFSVMLGIHCGMTYSNSRTAIAVSLGTLFFLCLGVATCMVMMVSFSGSFETQLIPFSFVILGGAVGLYVALGMRNPSPAIAIAALLLPFITFHAITSFTLRHFLTVFLESVAAYGFATLALLVPAIAEFDFAMGRTQSSGEE